ncbi:MAG: hypothetical protein CL912_01620 [Deltaproteobacteria bacterium]|nr:hypothetical protein [Deltaproteobacteria bacterium]
MASSASQRKIAGRALVVALLVVTFFSIISLISLTHPNSAAVLMMRPVNVWYTHVPTLPPISEPVSSILFSLVVAILFTIYRPGGRGTVAFGLVTTATVAQRMLPVIQDCTSLWRDKATENVCAADCWTQSGLLMLVCATATMSWMGVEWDGGRLTGLANWVERIVSGLIEEGRLEFGESSLARGSANSGSVMVMESSK